MSELRVMKGGSFDQGRLEKWLKEDGAVVLQIKRDEFRCMIEVDWRDKANPLVSYTSAQGKPLHNLGAFDSMWCNISHISGTNIFDTGVCINESFDITRRTLRSSTKEYDLTGTTQVIAGKRKADPPYYKGPLTARFWLYDLPEVSDSYSRRRIDMAHICVNFPEYTACPETFVVESGEEVDSIFQQARSAGHEGLMVKRYNHKWEPKRCPDAWMKLKPSNEVDGRIIGKTEGKGKFYGLIGSLICEAEDGSQFTISGMTDSERVDFTHNFEQYLGQWVVATFMERDTQGGYRHPQFNRMHDEKNL